MESYFAEELSQSYPSTVRLVDVKIRDCGEVKKLDAKGATLRSGDRVLLEVDGEVTYGVVYGDPYLTPFVPPMRMMKSILRKANQEEASLIARLDRLSHEATAYCRGKAAELKLRLKLVEVYGAIQRRQLTFVYTAEERIDFRELVRDLARRFGGRIEMRQVGVREEARRLGGIDTCGLVLCCASFLTDVKPVTVKQARSLGLPVEDPRLLGVCGRLNKDALPEAQADAYASLLDSLGISKVTILGMSAGGPSTLQFAIRHPERVKAMILIVPLAYTPETINDMQKVPFAFIASTVLRSDYLLWLTTKLNRKTILKTMGIPVDIQKTLTVEEQNEFIDWLFPLKSRVKGIMNDGKIATNLQPVPLYDITVPTLIITAQDDPWRTYPGSLYTARRIQKAELKVFDQGGHLFNGKEEEVKKTLNSFLQQVYSTKEKPVIAQ